MTAHENKTLQPSMALSISGLFILILANINPVLNFEVVGRLQAGYVITGVTELWHQGYGSLSFLVLFSGIVAPTLYMAAICYVSTACVLRLRLPKVETVFELIEKIEPWYLIPVYSIATVVAVVKLKMLGTVEWQPGARWILATAVLSLFCQQTFDRKLVIRRLRSLGVWTGTTRE